MLPAVLHLSPPPPIPPMLHPHGIEEAPPSGAPAMSYGEPIRPSGTRGCATVSGLAPPWRWQRRSILPLERGRGAIRRWIVMPVLGLSTVWWSRAGHMVHFRLWRRCSRLRRPSAHRLGSPLDRAEDC